MKEMILEKLKKVEDLEQRKLLREILTGFFSNLIDYQVIANQSLENRVFNEVVDESAKYDLFFTISSQEQVDPLDDFMYPVFPEELAPRKYDLREIITHLNKKEEYTAFPIFLKCDYPILKKLLQNKKTFQGELVTERNRYPIRVKLEQNRSYLEQIEHMYTVFQRNNIPWKTVNLPYANRFFDVVISEIEAIPGADENISEIAFNLEEFDPYKQINHLLFWNIEKLSISSSGFPMPAMDHVNYEHAIPLKKYGLENGYLIDEDPSYIRYIQRGAEELTIVSPFEKMDQWHVYKMTQFNPERGVQYQYQPLSNRKRDSFINKYAQKQTALIRTQSEIFRIVNAYEISKFFGLKTVEICDHKGEADLTYDLNYFITDDIRVANAKRVMKLKFVPFEAPYEFIRYDLLSFLVSEVQMYFPDYECVGELV